MSWLLMSSLPALWFGALVVVCRWMYGATKNGSDLDEGQVVGRMGNAA